MRNKVAPASCRHLFAFHIPHSAFRIFSLLFTLLAAPLLAASAPPLPPGVRLEPPSEVARLLPSRYRVEFLSVDWTHPLLRSRLVSGLPPGRDLPLPWSEAERKRPGVLRLQLSEPVPAAAAWSLALPLSGPPAPGDPAAAARRAPLEALPHFAITPLCPWLPAGPALERDPEFASPLAPAGALVAARWIGRVQDLDALTTLTFPERCLVSWTRTDTGRGRFALVVHVSGGRIPVAALRPWLAAETGPGDWLAFHSQGAQAAVGVGEWRLTAPSDPRRIERLGGALELFPLSPGQPVDWARLPGAAVKASTFESGYEPAGLLEGRLWPAPFAPRAWISQPEPPGGGGPWIELDLGAFRPVSRIALVWGSAAGWSGQFRPRRAVLKASLDSRNDLQVIKEIINPQGDLTEHRFAEPVPIRQLRLELPEPSAMPLDQRARLAAIQLWGPWDGKTGAR